MYTNNQKPVTSKEQITTLLKIAEDREFRQQLREKDADALVQLGLKNPHDGASPQIKVVTSTQDVTYLQLPFRANPSDKPITLEQVAQIQGGIRGATHAASFSGSI